MKATYSNLSKRESEVLFLIADQLTTKEIALRLFISPHTALTHRKNLFVKLQVKNTAGLIRAAYENRILIPGT